MIYNEKVKLIQKGLFFTVAGIILMIIATFILFYYDQRKIFLSFLIILLEPGGWFFFWEGLGLIIFESKKKRHELEFYEKVKNCNILFFSHTEDTKNKFRNYNY